MAVRRLIGKFVVASELAGKKYYKLKGHGWTADLDFAYLMETASEAESLRAHCRLMGLSKFGKTCKVEPV